MNNRHCRQMTYRLLVVFVLVIFGISISAQTDPPAFTRYLAFQVFTGAPSPTRALGDSGTQPLSPPPSKAVLKQFVQQIVDEIGSTGDPTHKLAFIIGPLAFDHTDVQLQQMIRDAFEIAVELNIAVGFHIDDSMFWARRLDEWQDTQNVEWLDWDGTPNNGRRIDWGPQSTKFAPQLCFNSPIIEAEVTRLASEVMGAAIQQEVNRLIAQGRPELFAGVIVGWETQLSQDFDTNQFLGYCALSNLGFSRTNPPQDMDAELENVVQTFIELWARGMSQAGIEPTKIYSHTSQISQAVFDTLPPSDLTYSQMNHFAPPSVSFGANYQPGFSTYPQTGQMQQLYDHLQEHGNPSWASAEGSTVNPAAMESVVNTETYLAWMFNHNATLVNIFGWGIGTKEENPFWKAAASSEALDAYRKFLSGQPLIEETTDLTSNVSGSLTEKIQTIQADLPAWLQNHPEQRSTVEALITQLDQDLKDGNYQDAGITADMLLGLIGE